MTVCSMCHEDLPATDFAFRSVATGVLQAHCRRCHAAYRRQHYLDNRETYIENERLRVGGHRERNRALIIAYLLGHPCVDCGETDPVVLDFDHREPARKRTEVSVLAARKPWPTVLAEIAKCDVRCACCHRRRTASQFGWRRAIPGFGSGHAGMLETLVAQERLPPEDPASPASDLRVCRDCHATLPASEFALKNPRTGLRATRCKACQRAYAKLHYRKNRQKYLDKAVRRNAADRDRLAALIIGYLRTHPCMDCGATDPTILEFDHRDGVEKAASVNHFLRAMSLERIVAEIAKCEVRCANCHRRRTARQFGWSRLQIGEDGVAA